MGKRLLFIIRLFVTLLLIFVCQKVVFMLVNVGHADGAPFGSCVAVLWQGLRLDSVTASYIIIVPVLLTALSSIWERMPLRRILVPYWCIVAVLMGVVFVADVVLYYFWGAKMDANDLMYATKPKDLLASLKWWTVVVGLLLLVAVVYHYWRRLQHTTPVEMGTMRSRWWGLLFIPVFGVVFLGMRGGVSESTANPSYAYFSKYIFCNHAALNPLFNMIHSLAKVEDLENEFKEFDPDEVEKAIGPCFESDASISDTLLWTSRPEILMIVWESGGWDMVMNDTVGPNMTRLADEGVVFSGCYANNFRTDRGLVSLLSGWMGLPTTSLMKMSDRCRRLPGLARTLLREGYATRFVYGGDVDFTNMRGYLNETGFERVDGSESFGSSRRKSSWGAPDAYTLLPSVLGKGEAGVVPDRGRRKAFDVVLTLSSHEPWEVPMQRLSDARKNAFAYTDSCIGVLVDSLRQMPLWDSLLIVIVPDHGVPLSGGQSTSDWSVSHIPMVWVGGAVRGHKEVGEMMMQSDLASTLLSQMGISSEEYVMSRNVCSPEFAQRPRWALHCFKNGCNLIDSCGVMRVECTDGRARVVAGDAKAGRETFVRMMLQYVYQKTAKL